MKFSRTRERRTGLFLLLIFIFLSAGLIITGYLYYKNFEKEYFKKIASELSVIADLKVDQLVQWRKERLADANVFYRDIIFSSIVKNYFKNKNDLDAKNRIQTLTNQVYSVYLHNKSCLYDTAGNAYFYANNKKNVPAVRAVLGHKGIWEGNDYRGVKVLSYLNNIPGTNWYMVSKIDNDEIFSESKFRLGVLILFILFLILPLTAGLTLIYNFRQRNIYKELYETHQGFKTTLYSIGDAVITTDTAQLLTYLKLT